MNLAELHRTGVTDNEDLGEHGRSALAVNFDVNFAHESGLEELFAQAVQHEQFKAALEAEFASVFRATVQKMVRSSSIPPGHGWTDDFEVAVSVSPKEANTL